MNMHASSIALPASPLRACQSHKPFLICSHSTGEFLLVVSLSLSASAPSFSLDIDIHSQVSQPDLLSLKETLALIENVVPPQAPPHVLPSVPPSAEPRLKLINDLLTAYTSVSSSSAIVAASSNVVALEGSGALPPALQFGRQPAAAAIASARGSGSFSGANAGSNIYHISRIHTLDGSHPRPSNDSDHLLPLMIQVGNLGSVDVLSVMMIQGGRCGVYFIMFWMRGQSPTKCDSYEPLF